MRHFLGQHVVSVNSEPSVYASFGGRATACFKFPLPSVFLAYLWSSCIGGFAMIFLGLKSVAFVGEDSHLLSVHFFFFFLGSKFISKAFANNQRQLRSRRLMRSKD